MSAVTAVPLRPLAKGSVPKLWIVLVLMVLAAAAFGWLGTGGLQRTAMPSGVQYQVIRDGNGDLISSADVVALNFVARRENGEVLADTRRDRPLETSPDNFSVPGLGEGLKLMRTGSVYRFWVPPRIYQGQLPPGLHLDPNEVLTFDVQVLAVSPGMAQTQRLQEMQRQMRGAEPGGAAGEGAPGAAPPAGNGTAPARPR